MKSCSDRRASALKRAVPNFLLHSENLHETNDLFGNVAKSQNPRQMNVSTDETNCQAHQCLNNATPQQTNTAANQRRRSTFSCSSHLAATALLTKVSDPAAGAIRLTSAWLRENSKEKKLSAMKATPPRKRLSLTTAQIAPAKPRASLIGSRSPHL